MGYHFGKTGTANINGKDVNGWFIGYVEKIKILISLLQIFKAKIILMVVQHLR